MKMQCRNLPENSKRTSSQLQYSLAWEVQRFDSLEGNITCDCSPSVQKRQLLPRFMKNMFCCLRGTPPCSLMQSISWYRHAMAVWSEWCSTHSRTRSSFKDSKSAMASCHLLVSCPSQNPV